MAFQTPLSLSRLRALAVEASADPRTVARVLRGEPVLALPQARILAALQRANLSPQPLPSANPPDPAPQAA